ncbi:MAG TPA: hypothetical protein VLI54_04730 [Bacillota bacterium]|nr:hypothetical protein [Bacillota bacterium]
MLLINRCVNPGRDRLAIYNPSSTLVKYQDEIDRMTRHWESEQARALQAKSEALLDASQAILGFLHPDFVKMRSQTGLRQQIATQLANKELVRRTTLSALGVALLLSSEWTDQTVVPQTVSPDGGIGTINDMIVDPNRWQEFRIHTPPVTTETGKLAQWYYENDLYSLQVRPAEPTTYLRRTHLPNLGISVDFRGLETVYPFVPAR